MTMVKLKRYGVNDTEHYVKVSSIVTFHAINYNGVTGVFITLDNGQHFNTGESMSSLINLTDSVADLEQQINLLKLTRGVE